VPPEIEARISALQDTNLLQALYQLALYAESLDAFADQIQSLSTPSAEDESP
jgi:hypothetical protein